MPTAHAAALPTATTRPVIAGRRHVVAAGHHLASLAGFEVLQAGGNAIDAGVAAGLALGVLESQLVSVAGVAPIILYSAEHDRVVTISGLGGWPRLADPDRLQALWGDRIPVGIERTVVPAAPDAWITALERFGRMGFADVAAFAIDFAGNGFPMYPLMAELIGQHRDAYARFPSNAAIYLPGGEPPAVGSLFRQTDLGASLQFMAEEDRAAAAKGGRLAGLAAARDAFYRGDIAARIVAWHTEQGGLLRAEDLADFRVGVEAPLSVPLGDWTVHGCGAWCQGPMLLQALRIAGGFDLRGMGHNSAAYLHVVTEALKIAAADREAFIGDPAFVGVPLQTLLSDDYLAARRRLIDPGRALPDMPPPGLAGQASAEPGGFNTASAMDTSYVCVADAAGNVFSATPSDASYNAPVVPGLGFIVSSRGQQSWLKPGHPSRLAPGKRPRLTPNPALAVCGRRMVPFGSPGGDVQTQAMLQAFLAHAVFGFDVQAAVEAPRVASYSFPSSFSPHKTEPGVLRVEARLGEAVIEGLAALGHQVEVWPDFTWLAGSVSMIEADRGAGLIRGGSDPRRAGYAVGW